MNAATQRAIVRNQELAAAFGAVLPPAPLTATPRRVGAVDATGDRARPVARSLDEAFGPGARNTVVIPMEDAAFDVTDVIVMRASVLCAAVLTALLSYEWIRAL